MHGFAKVVLVLVGTSATIGAANEVVPAEVADFCVNFNAQSFLDKLDVSEDVSGNADVQTGVKTAQDAIDAGVNKGITAVMWSLADGGLMSELSSSKEDKFGQDFLTGYIKSVATLAAPGLVMFALTLLCCPFCFICPGKCCTCFQRINDPGELSFFQKYGPLFMYLVFSLITVIFSLFCIVYLNKFSDGVVGTFCSFDQLSIDLGAFFQGIEEPIMKIDNMTRTTLDTVSTTIASSDDVVTDFQGMINATSDLKTYIDGISLPAQFSSSVLTEVSGNITGAITQMNSVSDPMISQLTTTKANIETQIVSVKDILRDVSSTALGQINQTDNMRAEFDNFLIEGKKAAHKYVPKFTTASFVFFSTVFLSFAAGIFVLLAQFLQIGFFKAIGRYCFNFSWLCSYLFVILLFLLAGIFMPATMILVDGCDVLYNIPDNFTGFMGSMMNASETSDLFNIVEGCFATPSRTIAQSLNISNQFNIDDVLDGFSMDMNLTLDYSQLDGLTTRLDGLNRASFGFDQQQVVDALTGLNNYAQSQFVGTYTPVSELDCTISNSCDKACLAVTTCASDSSNPNADSATLGDLRNAVMDLIEARILIDDVLAQVSTHVTNIDTKFASFNSSLNTLDSNLDSIAVLIQPLIDEVANVENIGDCTFIPNAYYAVSEQLCVVSLGPWASISFFFFIIAFMGLIMSCFGLCTQARLYPRGSSARVFHKV